jgi:hypothetical protein
MPVVKALRGNNRIGRNLGALIYAPESMLGIMLPDAYLEGAIVHDSV